MHDMHVQCTVATVRLYDRACNFEVSYSVHSHPRLASRTSLPRAVLLLEELVLGMVGCVFHRNQLRLAAAVALGFYAFLRNVEILTLTRADLSWDLSLGCCKNVTFAAD